VSPGGTHELIPTPAAWGTKAKYLLGPRDLLVDAKGKVSQREWRCGTEEMPLPLERLLAPIPAPKGLTPVWGKAGITSLHTATVAVDTDNEIMANKFGNNSTTATNYIASLFASMNIIYERDLLVRLLQGTTFLRTSTTPDPYTATSQTDKLFEFTNYWAANNGGITRAVALMLSGRGSSGAAGIAWIGVLCSASNGYAYSQVALGGTEVWFGDVQVTAHEIGHNFGSPHTHCYNTLGLPNPDNCYAGEAGSGCFGGTPSCPAPATYSGLPNITGTLMSYCNQAPGCSRSLVFHPGSVDLLDDIILSRVGSCVFPYVPPGPTVIAVTPNNGPIGGGTGVTITGTGFQAGATVSFGGTAAPGAVVVNSTTIGVASPAHATGGVGVTVTNPNGSSHTLTNGFFYAPLSATTSFYTLTPCRVLDTRNPNGPSGGPALGANATRVFAFSGVCGIPPTARAVSANVTVVTSSAMGTLGFYPGNGFPLGTSALGFPAGVTRAAQTMLELATNGAGTVGVHNASSGANHVIVDVNGYFE
jgi:hypothetical protein